MFSDKRYIVYDYVYQKQVVYAHIRKVKFPKTIRHTSVVAYNFHSEQTTRKHLYDLCNIADHYNTSRSFVSNSRKIMN